LAAQVAAIASDLDHRTLAGAPQVNFDTRIPSLQ